MGFRDKILGRHKPVATPAPATNGSPIIATPPITAPDHAQSLTSKRLSSPVQAPGNAAVPVNKVVQQALTEYVKTLPESERNLYLDAAANPKSMEDFWDPVKQQNIDHEQTAFLRKHADGISTFLGAFNRFLDLSATGLSASPQFVGIAVGATQVVIKIFTGFLSYFSRLSGMFGAFASYLGSLNKFAESAIGSQNIQEALKTVYIDILTFLRRARLVFVNEKGEKRTYVGWRVFWREFWKPFEDEFAGVEQDFKNHLQVLNTASAAENLGATFELLKAETDRRERELKDEREDFLRWISSIAFEDIHANIYRKKHPGTGDWLINDPRYKDWVDASSSKLLWCRGKPGSGKSVLASNIIEDLTACKAPDENVGFAFVYFNYQDVATQDERQIIAALIKQLCRKKNTVPKSFTDIKAESESPMQLGNLESFRQIAEQYRETYLVIDGLDECPRDDERESRLMMLQFISDAIRSLPSVKIVVTSRPESDIEDEFTDTGAVSLSIEMDNTQKDIENYVTFKVKELRKSQGARRLRIQDDGLETEIIQELTSKADGMFLWVDLQLKHLCEASRARKDSEVRKALQTLPKGLDATYSRNLKQIDDAIEPMRDIAIVTLQWVAYCERPLTSQEVQYAIALQRHGEDAQNEPLDLFETDVILDACANLLEVIKVGSTEILIRPIHYSVQEFLTKPSSKQINTQIEGILGPKNTINATIASLCMDYLIALYEEKRETTLEFGRLRNLGTCPLIQYATDSFDYHVTRTTQDSVIAGSVTFLEYSDQFRGAVLALRMQDSSIVFADIKMLLYATRLYEVDVLRQKYKHLPAPSDALVFACAAGLEDAVKDLLSSGADVNTRAKELHAKDTPLISAIRYKHVAIVRILLARGADPNLPNPPSAARYLPLDLAAAYNSVDMMELLIKFGADVNATGIRWKSPIHAAASSKGSESVKLLLKHGVDVKSNGAQVAIHAAARNANREMISLLLDSGMDINYLDVPFGSALQELIASNRIIPDRDDLVRWLIKQGADVNLVKGHYGTALQAAAATGYCSIIRILLDEGADVNSRGGYHGTPLLAALANNRKAAIKLLVDNGADLNTSAGRYGNALQAACNGDFETVQFLIDQGANVNARGGLYETALQLAAVSANPQTVELLISKGADVNVQGGYYGNALMAAICSSKLRNLEVITLLLTHGADPNSKNTKSSALYTAAEQGDLALVTLLLHHAADINLQSGQCGTALQAAASHGHEAIVSTLIEAHADINAHAGLFGNALQAAAAEGHLGTVKILLDNGADIEAVGCDGTALQAARRSVKNDIAEYLLTRGAVDDEEESDSESEAESGVDSILENEGAGDDNRNTEMGGS